MEQSSPELDPSMALELIPGVTFHPDGRFLIDHYLLPRAVHGRVPDDVVRDAVVDGVDVRAARPETLPFPRCNRLQSGRAWGYFFTTRRASSAAAAAAAEGGGRWERYGGEKAYAGADGDAVAFRTTFAFYDDNAGGEVRTPWRMKEFRLNEGATAFRGVECVDMDLVVWKVYNEVPDSDDDETSAANPNPNPAVGKAVISLDPLRSDEQPLQLKMEMAQADNVNTPKSYSLNISEEFVPMSAFSESTKGKLTCEGMTKNKFDMEPHKENLADYGKLCHERTRKSMIKARKVQVLENDHGISAGPMSGMVGLAPSGSKENKKPKLTAKPSDVKRTPMDSRELENIQYKLFDRQSNGPLKQLKQEPDQPEQLLKEIQNDTCVYNKGGPNQGNA